MISDYISFEHALKQTNMKTLQTRRMNLILKFGVKALKNERFKDWFVEEIPQREIVTRNKKPMKLFKEKKRWHSEIWKKQFANHDQTPFLALTIACPPPGSKMN